MANSPEFRFSELPFFSSFQSENKNRGYWHFSQQFYILHNRERHKQCIFGNIKTVYMKKCSGMDLLKASHRGNFDSGKTSVDDLRKYCVCARFNKMKLEHLNLSRGNKSKDEWLHIASLNQLPPVFSEINHVTWIKLGEIAQQFNRVISHLNSKSLDSGLKKQRFSL
ncbi:hypothetical protein R6Y99_04970 [Pseudomonas lundensis]|uniref:hypothetical protein n=1 Tax=Serratia proteamaculans TaxID=28151 RepID=UPI0029828FFC|nr:hypothetical protein [Serratia proteamaculans]MDW5499148.1 hypothetical protein [Serratia proteamaculans]MDW5504209.1 hypothetical protein [Pseudomonas lundensis]